jgi:hypothetical protein
VIDKYKGNGQVVPVSEHHSMGHGGKTLGHLPTKTGGIITTLRLTSTFLFISLNFTDF